jgi:TolB-like protein/Tfp pilus assembly protein PilF
VPTLLLPRDAGFEFGIGEATQTAEFHFPNFVSAIVSAALAMNPLNFFAELKRRNVVRMAGLYLVGAWLLVQVAGTVLPMFGAPDWLPRSIVILLAIGFLPTLIFSWAFELTPHGLKRDEDVRPEESIAPQTARRMNRMIIAVLVLALGYFAVDKFMLAPRREAAKSQTAPGANESQSIANAKSIAVLPFDNLSRDPDNAYFAEGIQDEILTRLSKIAALKVISRSSTQKYKSTPDNLREVGKQLGVANLLEGSVQKIANAVHVNVQLIRAATDEHLWAESYNRKLDDVFGVEGEVANAIADQLNTKLTGAEVKAVTDKPTQNAAAYDAYLRGLSIEHNDYSYGAFELAARAYVQAVQLDPKFALAWARLGIIRSFLYFNGVAPSENTAAAVKEGADHAMALAPEAGESWIAAGAYRYRVQRDFEAALAAYQEALKRLPNNSFVYQYLAIVQRRLGLWQEAESNYKKALELDPRDVALLNDMGNEFYYYLRRFDEGYAMLDRAQQLAPDSAAVLANKVNLLQAQGRLEEAAQELARIPEDATDFWVVNARGNQALYKRHYEEAAKVFERKINSRPADQPPDFFDKLFLVNLGYCYQWMGNSEEARKVFTRALQAIKPNPETVVGPDANGTPTILALAYAGLGDKENGLAQAQQALKDYASDGVFRPTAEITLAQVQAHFGDRDAAMAALPHLLEVPAGLNIATLKLDPLWDPMRKDPRFQKLCDAKSK